MILIRKTKSKKSTLTEKKEIEGQARKHEKHEKTLMNL